MKLIKKEFGKDFNSPGGALTLRPDEVCEGEYAVNTDKVYSRTHRDGWTIKGKIHEDFYEWVNEFEAVNAIFGRVWGNFENEVYADTEEGFNDFFEKHTPEQWDYRDIWN